MINQGPKMVTLLSAVITDETFSQPIDVRGYTHFVVYILPEGTVTSGAVTMLEGTIDPTTKQPYGGTWATIGSAISPTSAAGTSATHFTVGAYSHIQARVSTAIGGGGSVSIVLVAV